jgi:hypothetical protein
MIYSQVISALVWGGRYTNVVDLKVWMTPNLLLLIVLLD